MMLLAKTEMETETMPTDLERTDQSAQLSAQTHAPALPRPDREFVRFARHQRALHACMIVSFISLATTGLTLKFSYTGCAVSLLLGGFHAAVFIHRSAAVLMFEVFMTHLYNLYQQKKREHKSWWAMVF